MSTNDNTNILHIFQKSVTKYCKLQKVIFVDITWYEIQKCSQAPKSVEKRRIFRFGIKVTKSDEKAPINPQKRLKATINCFLECLDLFV